MTKEQRAKKEQKIKRLKIKANGLYKAMTRALKDAEEIHNNFHKFSASYAKVLKQIEAAIIKK